MSPALRSSPANKFAFGGTARILVISDTHIPRTAADIPAEIYARITDCDLILHAGDFSEKELYEKLAALKPVIAVCGNMDSEELRSILPRKETFSLGAYRIGLIHGHGPARDIMPTVRKEFSKIDAIVFGHSHSPENSVKDGVLFFNPGSPTDKVFSTSNTYGILTVSGSGITGEIVTLPHDN